MQRLIKGLKWQLRHEAEQIIQASQRFVAERLEFSFRSLDISSAVELFLISQLGGVAHENKSGFAFEGEPNLLRVGKQITCATPEAVRKFDLHGGCGGCGCSDGQGARAPFSQILENPSEPRKIQFEKCVSLLRPVQQSAANHRPMVKAVSRDFQGIPEVEPLSFEGEFSDVGDRRRSLIPIQDQRAFNAQRKPFTVTGEGGRLDGSVDQNLGVESATSARDQE
jgi:hypothetical protein